MSILSNILGWIGRSAVNIISATGYFGVFLLMVFESMVVPIPSELVMPFAGFLSAQGRFSFALVAIIATIGSLAGSLISYYIGYYGGNKLVTRFGKYVLLDADDLHKTEKWFKRSGGKTIFIGRLIPVVRHLISIPAGIGKMDLKKFCLYTVIGAGIWNTFLAYLGYILGKNWDKVRQYTEPISIAVAVLLFIAIVWFVWKHVKGKRRS